MISADTNASSWSPGPLGTFNFAASPSSTGMTVLRVGGSNDSDSTGTGAGLRLFYGSKDDGLVHELVSRLGSNDWSAGFVFPGSDAHAGIASNYADVDGRASVYHLDEQGRIRVWSHLYNTTVSPGHNARASYAPIGSWTQGTLFPFPTRRPTRHFLSSPLLLLTDSTITDPTPAPASASRSIRTDSSLSLTGSFVCYQEPSNAITLIRPPEHAGGSWSNYSGLGLPGTEAQPGSALAGAALVQRSVFFQANGSDVTQVGMVGGVWTEKALPVG